MRAIARARGHRRQKIKPQRLLATCAKSARGGRRRARPRRPAEHTGGLADPEQALAWFRKAAEQGHAASQFNLGAMHSKGEGGLAADPEQALAWFRKAAAQGGELLGTERRLTHGQCW